MRCSECPSRIRRGAGGKFRGVVLAQDAFAARAVALADADHVAVETEVDALAAEFDPAGDWAGADWAATPVTAANAANATRRMGLKPFGDIEIDY